MIIYIRSLIRPMLRSWGTAARSKIQRLQQIIDNGKTVLDTPELFPSLFENGDLLAFIDSVTQMHNLAKIMRKRRFDNGALSVNQPKLQFTLNPETHLPEDFHLFLPKESNKLVEEFMLLTNTLVATRIHKHFPKLALLRNHSYPNMTQLEDIVEYLKKVGININIKTAGNIQKSLDHYKEIDESKDLVLNTIVCKPMVAALYICAPEKEEDINKARHYALNMPIYTHFTSPIRRYPDIMVHRFLAATLGYHELPPWTRSYVEKVAKICNKKKYNSKKASEMSTQLFTKLYFLAHGPIVMDAVVCDIKDYSFDIILLPLGIITRLFTKHICKDGLILRYTIENGLQAIKLEQNSNDESPQTIKLFAKMKVEMNFSETYNKVVGKFISIIEN